MNAFRLEEIRQQLAAKLDDIISEHAGGVQTMSDSLEVLPDSIDLASQETDLKINLALRERERTLARDIRWALKQIEEGTYGVCEECDEPIAMARLMAFPATTLCVKCKEMLEQEQTYAYAR